MAAFTKDPTMKVLRWFWKGCYALRRWCGNNARTSLCLGRRTVLHAKSERLLCLGARLATSHLSNLLLSRLVYTMYYSHHSIREFKQLKYYLRNIYVIFNMFRYYDIHSSTHIHTYIHIRISKHIWVIKLHKLRSARYRFCNSHAVSVMRNSDNIPGESMLHTC